MKSADPPIATRLETATALAEGAKRRAVPIRNTFVQQVNTPQADDREGPLAGFVRTGDKRALNAYLLVHTAASAEPWDVRRESEVWARALGIASRNPAASMSKVWARLEQRNLISRTRSGRKARITLLREDGSDAEYTRPDGKSPEERFFPLDHSYWTDDYYQRLTLRGIAALLIAAHAKPSFQLTFERAPGWYGVSPGTLSRGFDELVKLDVLRYDTSTRKEPLAPRGFVTERTWHLQPPFARRSS